MSSTFNNPSNDEILEAIENAVKNADKKVCQKADLVKFNPRAQGDPLIKRFHKCCYQSFDCEAEKIEDQIWENQDQSDLIAYASTCGWMYGYSCAQDKAKNERSAKETQITDSDNNFYNTKRSLEQKTEEAENLQRDLGNERLRVGKLESEEGELKSEIQEELYPKLKWPKIKYFSFGFLAAVATLVAVIAIIIAATDWPM